MTQAEAAHAVKKMVANYRGGAWCEIIFWGCLTDVAGSVGAAPVISALPRDLREEFEHFLLDDRCRTGHEWKDLDLAGFAELREFARRASTGREPEPIPPQERVLLKRLALDFPPETWDRYWSLAEKLRDGTTSQAEHGEFLRLADRLESANVRRLEAVVELARLRGRSFEETFQELGLGPVGNPFEDAR